MCVVTSLEALVDIAIMVNYVSKETLVCIRSIYGDSLLLSDYSSCHKELLVPFVPVLRAELEYFCFRKGERTTIRSALLSFLCCSLLFLSKS